MMKDQRRTQINKICISAKEKIENNIQNLKSNTIENELLTSKIRFKSNNIIENNTSSNKLSFNTINKIEKEKEAKNEWDLKCYRHNHGDGYFFTYFLLNERNQTYQLKNYNTYDKLTYLQLHQDLYDFKLVDKTDSWNNAPYPICALVKWGGSIQYMATQYKFGDQMDRDTDINKTLILAKAYTQGYFSNYSNYFYFITYNDISDFTSGYSTNEKGYPNLYDADVSVTINNLSPFEFSDEVEIKEMKFLFLHFLHIILLIFYKKYL